MSQSGINKISDSVLPSNVPINFVTDSGIAVASGNTLNVNGAGGTTTSGSGNQIVITSTGGGGGGATTFITNSGTAIEVGGMLNVLGAGSIQTTGSGQTVTVQLTGLTNHSVLLGAGTNTITALANGTVGQVLTATAGDPTWSTPFGSLTPQTGTSPVTSSAGTISVSGAAVAAGSNPVQTNGTGAHTLTVDVQTSQAIASTNASNIGLAAFNSSQFSVDANGFVSFTGTSVPETLTGNSGGAISPTSNNINTVGTGSITIVGSGSTLTTQLTGLSSHAIQLGQGTATLKQLGPGSTGQVLQTNTSADPTWSTATYPSTTTVNQILYSSSANVVSGLSTANSSVLTTTAAGVPVLTSLATDGQLIIGSTAGAPAAATLTAGTGVSITNASNSITIGLNGSVVGQTITGNDGTALSPTAGNWNIEGYNSAVTGYSPYTTGSGSTMRVNMPGTVKWVVNATANLGTHTTVQAAITAASSGDDVFITPGTYTENLTGKLGVNVIASPGAAGEPTVTIIGKFSASGSGTYSISNIRLQTNSDYFLQVLGANATVVNVNNCYLNCSNNTGISQGSSNPGSIINLNNCLGDLGTTGIGLYTHDNNSFLRINNCYITNTGNSTTYSNTSVGEVDYYNSYVFFPVSLTQQTVITAASTYFNCSAINTIPVLQTNFGSAGSVGVYTNCVFYGGTASGISVGTNDTAQMVNCSVNSSNTNAMTGTGAITSDGTLFTGSSHLSNLSTQTGGAASGLTQGTAPSAGFLGEQIRATLAQGSAINLTNNTGANITSISLTPGIWDISCLAVFYGATAVTSIKASISATSQTSGTSGDNMAQAPGTSNGVEGWSLVVPSYRVTLSTTTTYYLVALSLFSVGTQTAWGRLSATRVG